MWKCGSKSAVHCKILRYNIAKTTSQKSCNSLPSQKLYTITCIIPLFTSRLAAKVKKKETWMVCSLHIQTAMYFQFKTLKVWISLKTMENMASTGAIALSTVTPAPGSHSAALPVGAACSWDALLMGTLLQGGSAALHLAAKRNHSPVSSAAHPVTRNTWDQWGMCRGSYRWACGAEEEEWGEGLSRKE